MSGEGVTSGTGGVVLGVVLVAAPLCVAFVQEKVAYRTWVRSPLLVVGLFVVGALAQELLHALLDLSGVLNAIAGFASLIAAGYVGGRIVGRRGKDEKHKRGSILEDGQSAQRETARIRERDGKVVSFAGVALQSEDETKHFKLIGTTGTGKSTAIRELLEGALRRGDRAVIADPDGGYLDQFYDRFRGDIVLNPFDTRSMRWDPFAEIQQPYDIEQLAASLVPLTPSPSGQEWRTYARTFVSAVIKYCYEHELRDVGELWRLLQSDSAAVLSRRSPVLRLSRS